MRQENSSMKMAMKIPHRIWMQRSVRDAIAQIVHIAKGVAA